MISVIKHDGKLFARNDQAQLEGIDSAMRFTGGILSDIDSEQCEYVEIRRAILINLNRLNKFARQLEYDDASDFYLTFRKLVRNEHLMEFNLNRLMYSDLLLLNCVEIYLKGPAYKMFFDDVNYIRQLTGCRVEVQDNVQVMRIFVRAG